MGLGRQRRSAAERADDRPGRLLPGPGDLLERCDGLSVATPRGAAWNKWDGNTVAYGFWSDGVYTNANTANGTGGSIELTTAWSAVASYEHFWTPSLRTSLYGTYVDTETRRRGNDCATARPERHLGVGPGGAGCNPTGLWAVGRVRSGISPRTSTSVST